VTTDEVLAEYLTFFSRAQEFKRRKAGMTVQAVLDNPAVRVIPQSRESFLQGLDLYLSRADKSYSMIDCISMTTMRREGLTDVLTNDQHFAKEGFRATFRV
jgi:predicted nucleic acid-binding protein